MPTLHRVRPALAAALVIAAMGCASPSEPDNPRVPPALGQPTALGLLPCEYGGSTSLCRLQAYWGDVLRSARDVTSEAQWSSSAPNIVRVTSAGVLQAVGPGEAAITTVYADRQLVSTFRVFGTGPPWYVLKGAAIEYHIKVEDERGAPLEGVLVEIIAGGNAGMRATSDAAGRAIFPGESVCGPITARGTKAGYREWVGSAIKCGRAGNGNWGSETVGPVVMTPLA